MKCVLLLRRISFLPSKQGIRECQPFNSAVIAHQKGNKLFLFYFYFQIFHFIFKQLGMAAGAATGELKATSSHWEGPFKAEDNLSGDGVYVEGAVRAWRFHSVHSSTDIHRYLAVQVTVLLARQRQFDGRKQEIEPTIRGLRSLRKGWMNGTYKASTKDDPISVSIESLVAKLGANTGKPVPAGYADEQLPALHPTVANTFELWGDVTKCKNVQLEVGAVVRIKTRGDSVFIETMTRADKGEFIGKAGGDVLNGWDKQLQQYAQDSSDEEIPGQDLEGAADDEWD